VKHGADLILRTEQAGYLDALHGTAVHALAAMARAGSSDPRDPLLARMEARAAERGYPISDPEVACLIALVTRLAQPKLVVELGANIGYGAIVMARAAGPAARVVSVEIRPELVEEARAFVSEDGLEGRVEIRHGAAIQELEKIEQPIDLLYVDCVKEEYPRYLEIAVPKLSARGVVLADNVLWKGLAAHETPPDSEKERVAALRAFNLALVSHPQLCSVVLPLGDGVAFAVKL
jgi:predicted O-methyltransferase YrrM